MMLVDVLLFVVVPLVIGAFIGWVLGVSARPR
jgi:hypothetical protein